MNANEIRDMLSRCFTMLYFRYQGKDGHIDPYYTPGVGYSYLLWYDGAETLVHGPDEAMNTPFFDGRSLAEISDQITDVDW